MPSFPRETVPAAGMRTCEDSNFKPSDPSLDCRRHDQIVEDSHFASNQITLTSWTMQVKLKDILTVEPLGPPSDIIRQNRLRLCDFLRHAERQVFLASGNEQAKIRLVLGWDDESLENLIDSPLLTHSSPHASMNAFPPMVIYPWVQSSIQRLSAQRTHGVPVHLRTSVTHNNLGDLRWRPYAWWHRTRDGAPHKTRLFSRSHTTRHKTILSLPIPDIQLSDCNDLDGEAIRLASRATNYAYFCLIYRAFLERHSGLHEPSGIVEVPLNIVNAVTFQQENIWTWLDFAHQASSIAIRTLDDNGQIVALDPNKCQCYSANLGDLKGYPILGSNFANFAQVYRFGLTTMIGAEKMVRYVGEMNDVIRRLYGHCGLDYSPPLFVPITTAPLETVLPVDEDAQRFLRGFRISTTLPILTADYGATVRERLDRLLALDYAAFSATATESAARR